MASLQLSVVRGVLRLAYKSRMATARRARERIAAAEGPSGPPGKLPGLTGNSVDAGSRQRTR